MMRLSPPQPMRYSAASLALLVLAAATWGQAPSKFLASTNTPPASSTSDAPAIQPASAPPAIIVGFLGGFVRHDNAAHGGVQVAQYVRQTYPSGVYVNVFENHRGDDALHEVYRVLDADHDGALSLQEKRQARVILYGHSWGGSEAVNLARRLEREGVPVMLTIQIDSVRKAGEDDAVIPANVARAINFYQRDGGFIHGRSAIRAADPVHTQILGSFRYDYSAHPIACDGYPWFARLLENPHIEIECDPSLIHRVESLIRSELSPSLAPSSTGQ